MNIQGTSVSRIYSPTSPLKTSATKPAESMAATNPVQSPTVKKDTAEIRQAASFPQAAQVSDALPDEAHAVPLWQVGFYHDITYMTILGTRGDYVDPKSAAYMAGSQSERAEYGALLHTHVQDLYKSHGLSDAGERYRALKSVPGLDDKLHQAFNESVKADSRMMSLMSKLGIAFA